MEDGNPYYTAQKHPFHDTSNEKMGFEQVSHIVSDPSLWAIRPLP